MASTELVKEAERACHRPGHRRRVHRRRGSGHRLHPSPAGARGSGSRRLLRRRPAQCDGGPLRARIRIRPVRDGDGVPPLLARVGRARPPALGHGAQPCDVGLGFASLSRRWRRWYHHFTFYGFLLCFAATCVAALFDWLGHPAPYPWWSAPVVLGSAGGIGLTVGTIGLLAIKARSDRVPFPRTSMDVSFLLMLLLTAVTGFLVLFFRTAAAMGILLLIHLGVVMGLFLTLPYGKFIHGFFRYAALARYAIERAKRHPETRNEVI